VRSVRLRVDPLRLRYSVLLLLEQLEWIGRVGEELEAPTAQKAAHDAGLGAEVDVGLGWALLLGLGLPVDRSLVDCLGL
jgi:hypothetical protein